MPSIFFALGALPLLYLAVHNLFLARKYPVHSKGIILITGASTGIGRHAAEHISHKYPDYLVLAGVRTDSDADSISQLKKSNLSPIKIDVSSHDSIVAAVYQIKTLSAQKSIPLIAVVNNAGIGRCLPAEVHDVKDAKRVFDTNFFGVLDLIQATLPLLRESKGRIINMSSVAGLFGGICTSIYAASKFALEGFSDSLRREVAAFDISVSVIEPAFVRTPILDKAKQASSEIMHSEITDESVRTLYNRTLAIVSAKEKAYVAKASDPIVTSQAIEDSIVNDYPKTRYVVANVDGLPAVVLVWLLWLMPDRLEDLIV